MEKTQLYKIVVVDDEEKGIRNIATSLTAFPGTELVGTARNASEARKVVIATHPDLLFLDVEMPMKSGFEFLNEIKDMIKWDMQVVFYTAYDRYLLDALRASAFDFLLKPYGVEDFKEVMKHFFNEKEKKNKRNTLPSDIERLISSQSVMVATATGYRIVKLETIVAFEYQKSKKCWTAWLLDEKHIQLKRGTSAENILGYSTSFIRINQQYIINIHYLSLIDREHCILFPPYEHIPLKISRSYYKQLLDRFDSI